MYTVPNAPRPINWPFLHEIGGGVSAAEGGWGGGEEEGLMRALDLRMQEVILSARAPGNGGWFSWLSSSPGGRKTRDRRTEPKKSCIWSIWGEVSHCVRLFCFFVRLNVLTSVCEREKGIEIILFEIKKKTIVFIFFLTLWNFELKPKLISKILQFTIINLYKIYIILNMYLKK